MSMSALAFTYANRKQRELDARLLGATELGQMGPHSFTVEGQQEVAQPRNVLKDTAKIVCFGTCILAAFAALVVLGTHRT
jgi:hypothetical protein